MISELVARQRAYYATGATRSYGFRKEALAKLAGGLETHQEALYQALQADLNKTPCESHLSEVGMVRSELRYHQKHLRKWTKPKRMPSAIGQLPGRCNTVPEPYGVTLIMAPWNYPVNLCLTPLIGAISAGNTAIVKPSADAPATSRAIADLIADCFPPEYIAAAEGGREVDEALLAERFDYIFFTGSVPVGKVVMEAAAKHLTPVTLELGGKSPVIVDESANIPLAAKRIAFGKVLNAGQTCVEPDYLFIHRAVQNHFLSCYQQALDVFFPQGDLSQMATIVNRRHYERLKGLMTQGRILLGGQCDDDRRFIAPTVIDQLTFDAPIMQEEIFGPILPLFPYDDLEECIQYITAHERPLALYLFTQHKAVVEQVLNRCSFGGGCINDTILHLASQHQPFGGVGYSGMGSYHGKQTFDTFTHQRSVFRQSTKVDVPLRYPPYGEKKLALLKRVLK